MRQLTYIQPGVLEWHDVPEPQIAGPRQAIVAPVAATTCDLDRSIIKGRAPYRGPIALGHEFVAAVMDVGDGVRGVVPGDVVAAPAQISCGECDRCCSGGTAFCRAVPPTSMYGLGALTGEWGGGFSDLVRVPFADAMLVRLPVGVAPESVAAASDNLTNAFEAVVPHLERRPGASVLIAGVGATGFYAIQMAKALGAGRVDYLDHDRGRLGLAAQFGANAIEVGRGKPQLSLERQYEIAVDARGEPAALALLLRSLGPRGVCTSMSLYFRETPLPLLEMTLRGVRFETTPTNIRAHLAAVLSLVQAGRLAPERVTTEILPWEDLPAALAEPSMKPVFVREAPSRLA
jgi:threonine dehydrogenase-like Zn-dependent dehydrogenase